VLRWIARGWLGGDSQAALVKWPDVEFLRGNPAAADREGDCHRINRLRAPEIARMVDALPYLHAAELLSLTPVPLAADALEIMTLERQVQVFEEIDPEMGARLLTEMAPDAAADLLGWIDPGLAAHYLELVPEGRRERIIVLLGFPPETAGGIMTNDVVTVPANLTVGEARQQLQGPLRVPDFVYYVYVVAAEGVGELLGVMTLRDLLVGKDEQPVTDLMVPHPVTLDPLEPAARAARRLADAQLSALPVVGSNRKLLGALTFDAALRQLAPRSWRDQAPRLFS
jgi:magnesium transporter